MMMLLTFLALTLRVIVVSGQVMCKGPYAPPDIVEVITTPVYDHRNRLTEADVSVEIKSRLPVHMQWVAFGLSISRYLWASEDNERFRSSVDTAGDRHIFRLHTKLPERFTIIRDLHATVSIIISVKHECNVVNFDMRLDKLVRVTKDKMKLPTITEMPRLRYVTNRVDLNAIRVGFSYGPQGTAPLVTYGSCHERYARSNDQLKETFASGDFNSSQIEFPDLGITETTCTNNNPTVDLDSLYVSFAAYVSSEEPDGFKYNIHIDTEFRRTGVNKPAIMVTDMWRSNVVDRGDFLVIPTKKDTTWIACLAEAATKPHVAVARIHHGSYQLLTESSSPFITFHESLRSAYFAVNSPRLAEEEEEFICSAASGDDVVSQKFKVMRHVPVLVHRDETAESVYVPLEKAMSSQFNLTCEATGVPQPNISFYYWFPNLAVDKEKSKDSQIHDSDLFETTTVIDGETTFGRIIIKNTSAVFEALSPGYWDVNNYYVIQCYAFNEFTSAWTELIAITL